MLPTPQERPTLTPQEVSKLLGIGRDKTYELIKNGTIPSLLLGTRYLVPTANLWTFLNVQIPSSSTQQQENPQ
jgi:excisionase family DNA binding protein